MPRGLLPPPADGSAHAFAHDAVALSFFVVACACAAATLALVSSVCSACGRRPKAAAAASGSDKPDGTGSVSHGGHVDLQEADAAAAAADDDASEEEEEEVMVTLSPELATHGPIAPVAVLPPSTSRRRPSMSLSKSLSMTSKIPDKLRLSRRRRERRDRKVESEDTLWKKGIILGEKCRVPGERRDGEAAAGDAVDPADELLANESFRRSSSFAVHQQQDAPALDVHREDRDGLV